MAHPVIERLKAADEKRAQAVEELRAQRQAKNPTLSAKDKAAAKPLTKEEIAGAT